MALIEAVTLGLIALIITPSYFFYFDITPKVVILLFGTAALLVATVRRRDLPGGPGLFAALLCLNAVSLALSTIFSTNRALSLFGSTWRSFGLATQLAAMLFAWLVAKRCVGRQDGAITILRGLALAGTISAAYGISQYFGWDPLQSRSSYRIGEGVWAIVRPPGTLGYASYFATWLVVTVCLNAGLAMIDSNNLWRAVAAASAALSLTAMWLTGTRAAVLGLIAGGLVWLWWNGFRIPRRAISAGLILLLCGAGFYYSPMGLQMRSRSRWFVEDPWGGARPLLWRDSLLMALKAPLFGYGPEVFLAEFPLYESKALAQAYPDFVHESPHNMFLDALVSQGIPGFIALAGLCAAGFAAAWKLKKISGPIASCMAAAMTAAIVSTQFTAFTLPTALLFFVVIAMAAGLATPPGEPVRNPLLSFTAPILVLAMIYLAVRMTVADHELAVTKRLIDAGNLRDTTREYEKYWYWRLPGANASLWYSRAWMDVLHRINDPATAQQVYGISSQSAMLATEDPEQPFAAWYNLAQVSALREDYRTTETSLRRAIQSHPYWFKPHWLLAQELELSSNFEDAKKEATLAAELDAGHHPEVTETLQRLRAR